MFYWRLFNLVLFVVLVCVVNLPRQIASVEYGLAHGRTRMLELQLLTKKKDVANLEARGYSPALIQAMDEVGWVYFELSDVTKAEATFIREFTLCSEHQKPGFDPVYERCLVSLSSYYRERSNFERSEHFYLMLREYDIAHTDSKDPRRARDLANLGLLYYLWAMTLPEIDKRMTMLTQAECFCETAVSKYQTMSDSQRLLGNVYATQALVLRDLGLPDRAKAVAKRSKEILASAGNSAVLP